VFFLIYFFQKLLIILYPCNCLFLIANFNKFKLTFCVLVVYFIWKILAIVTFYIWFNYRF